MKIALYLLIVLPAIVVFTFALLSFFSRRPETLGVQEGRLRDCPPSPNCVCSLASDDGHRVAPLKIEADAGAALEKLASIVSSMPNAKVITRTDDYLHAEFTSTLFRFVDDVEFHLVGNKIEVRSASRAGHSDFGVNRKRVDAIRSAWTK